MNGSELFNLFDKQADSESYGLVVASRWQHARDLFDQASVAARGADDNPWVVRMSHMDLSDARGRTLMFMVAERPDDWLKIMGFRFQWLYLLDVDEWNAGHIKMRLRPSIASSLWLNGEPYGLSTGEIAADIVRSAAVLSGGRRHDRAETAVSDLRCQVVRAVLVHQRR